MLCRAPVATTELSGQPSQVFAVSRAKNASGNGMKGIGSFTCPSQSSFRASGGRRSSVATAPSSRFTAPSSLSKMWRHTVATTRGGMTTGSTNRARYAFFIFRPGLFNRSAMATPRMTWMMTLENAQNRLKNSSRRNSKFGMSSLLSRIRT